MNVCIRSKAWMLILTLCLLIENHDKKDLQGFKGWTMVKF